MQVTEKILGIDVGSNSVGWALVSTDGQVIDMGSYVFPEGVKNDDYSKSGKEISKNAGRRMARGIRRGYHRWKLRRDSLQQALKNAGMMPEDLNKWQAHELYQLRARALSEKLTLEEIGRILLHLNSRRGFKSNRKNQAADEKEEGLVKSSISVLSKRMEEGGFQTIGQLFASFYDGSGNHPDAPSERIRNLRAIGDRFVGREMYENEFDAVWEAQQKYYPDILTGRPKDASKTTLYHRLKNEIIFFQRPLKSQKGRVNKCSLEPQKTVIPKSHPLFQEFRIWQQLANIQLFDVDGQYKLSLDAKHKIAGAMMKSAEVTEKAIRKIANIEAWVEMNAMPKFVGHRTNATIIKAIGEQEYARFTDEDREQLWHVLYFANDDQWLKDYLIRKFALPVEAAQKLSKVSLEPDYGNLSARAIRRMLPYMTEQGLDYAQAAKAAGYHHSYDAETQAADRELKDKMPQLKANELRSPLVQQSVAECIKVVNAIIATYGKPDRVRLELAREFQMPKEVREEQKNRNVQKDKLRQVYAEFLTQKKLLNKEVKRTDAEILKFELWLELGMQDLPEDAKQKSFSEFIKKTRTIDLTRHALWLECNRISPYSGKLITLADLFSPNIEIEHIIPYSKSLDNSFANKTLCEKHINAEKKGQTPWEYFQNKPKSEWEEFVERSKAFPHRKRELMLMKEIPPDFKNSQMNNTAWVGREMLGRLKEVFRYVEVRNGQATGTLRRAWGLNRLLNPDNDEVLKNRKDHRHHAVDALVVALTSREVYDEMAQTAKLTERGQFRVKVDLPFPDLAMQAENILEKTIVAHLNTQKLFSVRKYRIITGKKRVPHKTQLGKFVNEFKSVIKRGLSVRGSLHEDTFYGVIHDPAVRNGGDEKVVVRKTVNFSNFYKWNHIDKIVDPKVREQVQNRIKENGGDFKKAFSSLETEPIWMYSRKGVKVPINSVRVIAPLTKQSLIQLRPAENKKLFAAPGNNFIFAIYQEYDKKNKLKLTGESISYFDAIQKARKKLPIVPLTKDGKVLKMTLQKNDLLVLYQDSEQDIRWDDPKWIAQNTYRVYKFSGNSIFIVLHNIADKNDENLEKDDSNPVKFKRAASTLKAVKIRVNRLGKIVRA